MNSIPLIRKGKRTDFYRGALLCILLAVILVTAGCGAPGDPIVDDLYTQNVYPGTASTYSIGSEDYPYLEGWFDAVNTDNLTAGGSLHAGNAINYTSFDGNGVLTMAGSARTTNSVWVDAGGIKAPGAKPATAIAHGALETPAWQFANQAIAGNQETVSFNIRIPERMDRSVEPTITIGWSSTTNAGNAKWQLEYLWTSLNEDTTAAAQETLTVTTAASGTAEGLVTSTFTGIDVPSDTDICVHCRITRLSADAADTIADTLELHGLCLSWTSNKLGG